MLDKLDLNKLILTLLFFGLFCCSRSATNYDSTLVSCADGRRLLIKYFSPEKVKKSILANIEEMQEYNFTYSYTAISDGNMSLMINNFKPEEMNRCNLEKAIYSRRYLNFIKQQSPKALNK